MIDRRRFLGLTALGTGAWLDARGASGAHDARAVAGTTAETTSGRVRGLRVEGIHAFKGVPYAASTAPPHRFMLPRKPQPWTGVRDATALGHRSPQLLSEFHGVVPPELEPMDRNEPMGEDCLVLNVWTAGLRGGARRPVMVWLHGGGYTTGSGGFVIYDGTELAR